MRSKWNAVADLIDQNVETLKYKIGLQRVQVRHQLLELLLIQLIGKTGHHIASAQDALLHMLVRRRETTGQIFFLVELLESWSFIAFGRICRMAVEAIDIENTASAGLLLIQPQLSVSHLRRIFAATGQSGG